jgi:hypothetical protein
MSENGPALCLACADKLQSILDRQFIQNAAMMNAALDDMDAAVGMTLPGGRVPVTAIALAMKGKSVLNNIQITNSNVGMLNTGDLARIDAVITLTKNTDVETIGSQIQKLTQSIVNAADVAPAHKKEMLDLVQTLGEQVVGPRKPSVIKALLISIEDRAKGAAAIFSVVQGLSAAIKSLFGI